MKKLILIPATVLLFLCGVLIFTELSAATEQKEQQQAMAQVIRLHVRAEDNSPEEQALKLLVRNGILQETETILSDCSEKENATELILANIPKLEQAGQAVADANGANHKVTVTLKKETFEYREYDGFFLPAGEYDSLLVTIGSGEGDNWWCVVFPAACTIGAAEEPETHAEEMPVCFRIAKTRDTSATVKFWIWEKLKECFS